MVELREGRKKIAEGGREEEGGRRDHSRVREGRGTVGGRRGKIKGGSNVGV